MVCGLPVRLAGRRKTHRAYTDPRVFRPLRKWRPRFFHHRRREAAIPFALAFRIPERTRSRMIRNSNSANTPDIWIKAFVIGSSSPLEQIHCPKKVAVLYETPKTQKTAPASFRKQTLSCAYAMVPCGIRALENDASSPTYTEKGWSGN